MHAIGDQRVAVVNRAANESVLTAYFQHFYYLAHSELALVVSLYFEDRPGASLSLQQG